MTPAITILIDGDTETYIQNDDLDEIVQPAAIHRASHVEPNADGKWEADLAPVGGPVLGPYDRRREALDAEVEWLRENILSI